MKKLLYILCLSFIVVNCDNASEDDLLEPTVILPTDTVDYTTNIKMIIDNNCITCHSNPPVNGAPISLITYNDVVNAVNNGNLINRISAQAGEAGAMPFGGPRLPQNLIDLVIQWQADGLLEN